jgi:hypothetical protein
MNSSQRKDAFLCHGYEDKPMVRSVSLGLDQYEITTWFDEAEMRPGDHLVDKISEAIDKADWFCAFLTPNSVEKDWVKFELSLAMNREIESGEIFIIPILLYNCIIPSFLRDKLYVDLRDWGNYEAELEKLVRTIKGDTAYLPKDFDISKLNDPNVSDEYILSLPRSQATLELNLRSEKKPNRGCPLEYWLPLEIGIALSF